MLYENKGEKYLTMSVNPSEVNERVVILFRNSCSDSLFLRVTLFLTALSTIEKLNTFIFSLTSEIVWEFRQLWLSILFKRYTRFLGLRYWQKCGLELKGILKVHCLLTFADKITFLQPKRVHDV